MKLVNFIIYLVVVGLFFFSIIPQKFHQSGFSFHNGGDDSTYFNVAKSFATLNLISCGCTIGYPLTLTPILILKPNLTLDQLRELVSLFSALILFPLGQLLLFNLTRRVLNSNMWANLTVTLWTILPVIVYLGLQFVVRDPYAGDIASHLIWGQLLTEGLTTIISLATLVLFLRSKRESKTLDLIVLGILTGYLTMLRMTGIVALIIFSFILLMRQNPKRLLIFFVTVIIVTSPQLLYNQFFFSSPIRSGYLQNSLPFGLFSFHYLLGAAARVWQIFGPVALLFLLSGTVALQRGYLKLQSHSSTGARVIFAWVLATMAIYAFYYYTYTGDLIRFLIPIFPFICLILIAALSNLLERQGVHESLSS